MRFKSGSFRVHSELGTIQLVSKNAYAPWTMWYFQIDNTVSRTHHACGTKFQSAREFSLIIAQPGMPVGELVRSESGHCSLAALWSKDPGQARGGRRFRIDAWPLAPVPAIIPLDVQLRLEGIASEAPRRNAKRRTQRRHAWDKRWQRKGKSSSKQY